MPLTTVTAPTAYPVSISDTRLQLRVNDDSLDEIILGLIPDATAAIQSVLGGVLMPQQIMLTLDTFIPGAIDLSTFPVRSIESFVYDNSSNVETAMVADTDYYANLAGKFPMLWPVDSWPTTYTGKPGAVRITMNAGYASIAEIPGDVRRAILIKIKEMFDYGDDWITGTHSTPMNSIQALLFQQKRLSL